jgi:hypothetical protein
MFSAVLISIVNSTVSMKIGLKVLSNVGPVGTVSKCTKDAENVYAPLVMVSIGGRKMTGAEMS